jgi:hypothetical protein
LAALWHLLTEQDKDTELVLKNLHAGSNAYLTSIANRWRQAMIQERTEQTGNQNVQINLTNRDASMEVRINFPDVAGETYRDMWEQRTCLPEVVDMLRSDSVLLFINADTIQSPRWVVDEVEQMAQIGIPLEEGNDVAWEPQMSPTQVQIVDLLQLLCHDPLDIGARKLTVLLSAWDRVEAELLTPAVHLEQRLPLLHQYLLSNRQQWDWSVSGLSAQGGIYDDPQKPDTTSEDAERLRELDQPSDRIQLVGEDCATEDLTSPFARLVS